MAYLEHIGIATDNPAKTQGLYNTLLGKLPYKSEELTDHNIRTHFIDAETTKLELLESLDPDSAVAKFLRKHGEGLHHLAFEVEDIHAAHTRLTEHGLTPLTDEPKPGADDRLIFFLHPRDTGGVLVEFCQLQGSRLEPEYETLRDGRLAVYERGDRTRPSILVLHGMLGATELEMGPIIRALERNRHVLAVDLPGHGNSERFPTTDWDLATVGNTLREVTRRKDLGRFGILGFSFGGVIALHLAHMHTAHVSFVIAHGANPFWSGAETADLFDPDRIEDEQPEWATRLAEIHGSSRWRELSRQLTHITAQTDGSLMSGEDLREIQTPVLAAGGDQDPIVPPETVLRLHNTLPQSQLAILPGIRHAFQHIDPAVYGKLVHGFLHEHVTETPATDES